MKRKGSFRDLGVVIALLIFFVISGLFTITIYDAFKTKYISVANPDALQISILNKGSTMGDMMMNFIPVIIIIAGVGALISAFLIPSNPVFLPISIIILILYVIVSSLASNLLYEFITNSVFITIASGYPVLVSVIINFPKILAVIGFLLIIVMYSKSGGEG